MGFLWSELWRDLIGKFMIVFFWIRAVVHGVHLEGFKQVFIQQEK